MRYFTVLAVLLIMRICLADIIDDLLIRGDLVRAERWLYEKYGDDTKSPEYLFLQGKTDLSGENSASFLKDYINRSTKGSYVPDWARLILGKYYISQGLYVTARTQLLSITGGSPFYEEAKYLAARCYFLSGEYEDVMLKCGEIVDRARPGSYANWARLSSADAFFERGHFREAERLYYELVQMGRQDDTYALALLGMIESSKALGRPDDAQRYLEIYNDDFRNGLDIAPVKRQQPVTESRAPADKAEEKPESVGRYYIQVGAFSKKDNAIKIAGLYRESGYQVYMETFIENGREYYRILIGGYNSKQQAEFIKRRLEKAADERYLLLTR